MADKTYLQVAFQEGGIPYTYHNDEGHVFQPGDRVKVTTPRGTEREVTVVAVHPPGWTPESNSMMFTTKPCFKA